MIKLSKSQKEIEELAGRVPQLTDAQRGWATSKFNYFRVISQGTSETRCPNCKHVVPLVDEDKKKTLYKKGSKWCKSDNTIRCPHCGATIQFRVDRYDTDKQNNKQDDFFQVMNVVGGWQVTRLFYMRRYCYTRKENTDWEFYEVCQAWNNPAYAKTHFRAFPKTMMCNYRFNPYKLTDGYAKRTENGEYVIVNGCYVWETRPCTLEPRMAGGANYFESRAIAPRAQILPYYKQKGFTRERMQKTKNAMWLFECFADKNYKPMYETLMKADDWKMFDKVTDARYRDNGMAEKYFSAWKVCQRNHYSFGGNYTEWLDLVDMLIDEGKDIHNPHYVCPASVHEMHQQMLEIKNAKERREQRERERKELMEVISKYDDKYTKRIAKYLNMDIHDDSLSIAVLPNISAFYEEGLHMCHCVYRCRYYLHDDSLIMSARDSKGKRWETIEVSLKDFTIIQSYGYGDKHTAKHREILNLVESNMWQIKQRMKMVA